jgi:hypothetical protein
MKTPNSGRKGSALVTVAIFSAIATFMLASVLVWAKNQGSLVRRQAEFTRAQYVAEAGAEKIFAAIRSNVWATGAVPTQTFLNNISTNQLPTANDSPIFADYRFVSLSGSSNQITVTSNGPSAVSPITSGDNAGLNAIITPYRIVSRANSFNRPVNLTTGVQRDMQIQMIPVFQFAIFYNLDMEIENGAAMTINGRVHSNNNAYFAPNSTLTFQSEVTIQQNAYNNPMPGDTHQTSWNTPVYNGDPDLVTGVSELHLPLPIGVNPHDIIELPPSGTDPIQNDRLYNKAGLHIVVGTTGAITFTDGSGNNVSGITVGTSGSSIVSTNKTLYNVREGKTIALTEVNIGNLVSAGKVPGNGIVYVANIRNWGTLSSTMENAVRLVNGANLISGGLTIASQNPVYIQGNYNSVNDYPAAVYADAINILSGNWNDAYSDDPLSSRNASSTTINAAVFTGIVATSGDNYSGGVENLLRLLEDWSGDTLTYEGSLVVMFTSETATGIWKNTGSDNNVYNAPTRNWSFDVQFLDSTKLPPGTSYVRSISRGTWASVQ